MRNLPEALEHQLLEQVRLNRNLMLFPWNLFQRPDDGWETTHFEVCLLGFTIRFTCIQHPAPHKGIKVVLLCAGVLAHVSKAKTPRSHGKMSNVLVSCPSHYDH